jgi:soluble lytic murein transglycosylase-like protein
VPKPLLLLRSEIVRKRCERFVAASLLQCGERPTRRTSGVRKPFISKAALILLVTCALYTPAQAQQSRPRRNSYSGPVKIRVRTGETIPLLAERYNVMAVEIARLNNRAVDAALQPGEEVFMPSVASTVSPLKRTAAGITNDVRARAAQYEPVIAAAAARTGVDPRLLWTIAFLESRFKPGVVSYKNGQPCAYGLMQFIPSTAGQYGLQNPFDGRASIEAAARYVRDLAARFGGRADLVLASYNAGEGAVEAYRKGISIKLPNGRVINPNRLQTGGIPPYAETQNYVSRGFAVAQEISQANIFSQANLAAVSAPLMLPLVSRVDNSTAGGGASSGTDVAQPEPVPQTPVSSYASGNQPTATTNVANTQAASESNGAAPRTSVTRSFRATPVTAQNVSSSRVVPSPVDSRSSVSAPADVVTTQTRSTYVGGVAPQR